MIEMILDKQLGPLLEDVNQTVEDINQKLPSLLEHVNQLALSIRELSEEEIQPTLHNVQETTETLNRNITKIDELISIISEFSKQTVDRMSLYRDRLSIPFSDLIGFCAAFKAGFEKFTSKNN
jgi:ABC-type transporter Mla subunit MlaD